MDDIIDKMESKRRELTKNALGLQFEINEINTKISSRKMQIQNFKNQGNNVALNSAFQSMKFFQMQLNSKTNMLNNVNNALDNLQKAEVNEVKEETNIDNTAIKSGNKYVNGAMIAQGHLKTVHGHLKGRNPLFYLIVLFALFIDIFSVSGTPFGVVPIPFLGVIPVFIIIELFFIIWFLIQTQNFGDFVLIAILFSLKRVLPIFMDMPFESYLKYVPFLIVLLFIKYKLPFECGGGDSVNFKSIMWTGILFAVFAIIFSLVPMMSSLSSNWDIGTVSESPDDTTSSSSTLTSSAISGVSDFWCKIAPIFCDTSTGAVEDDGTDDGVSDGTTNNVDLALAVPLKTVSTRVDDLDSSGEFNWKIKNDGLKSIDSVLFLMDASQIQDNHSGKIYELDTDYNLFSDKIEYSGVDIDSGLFYKQVGLVSSMGGDNIKVKFDSPQCSFTQFKAPVYLLYTYKIDSNIMLTFGSKDWSDKRVEQGVPLNFDIIKSVSTVGPFSVSIYPDEMKQPVIIDKDESFTIYIEIVKNHPGRAAISRFDIDISPKLIPQDLDTTRCSLVGSTSDSSLGLDSYVLRDVLFNQINTVDLLLNNGLNKDMIYKCSFKYASDNFDKDLGDGSAQRYVGVYIEYTYIYDGMFVLNTGNFTGIDVC